MGGSGAITAPCSQQTALQSQGGQPENDGGNASGGEGH